MGEPPEPLVLKGEACTWYEGLNAQARGTYGSLILAFKTKYGGSQTPEKLWRQLLKHKQMHWNDFSTYETTFKTLWERWIASFEDHGIAPDFLKRERFIAGLLLELCEKVEARYPHIFDEALQIATQNFQKLCYKVKQFRDGREKIVQKICCHKRCDTTRRDTNCLKFIKTLQSWKEICYTRSWNFLPWLFMH